jgi:hypothetical protein
MRHSLFALTCVIPESVAWRYRAPNFHQEGNTMRALILSLSLACLAAAAPAGANEHAAHDTSSAPAAARWQADPALAGHMHEIGTAVDALQHYTHGHMDAAQGAALATIIEDHVNQIIATCKLPPEQHARLHEIITPLLDNAGALKAAPARVELVKPLRKAMQDYQAAFGTAGQG